MLNLTRNFKSRFRPVHCRKPHLSASISRGFLPCAQLLTIQAVSKAARNPRAQPVPIGQKGCKQKILCENIWAHPWSATPIISATMYLKQTVPHKRDHQLMSVLLPDQGSILWCIHAGEIKHGHIWLSVVVDGIVQGRELVVCAKISCLTGVGEQRFLVDIVSTQQAICFYVVLNGNYTMKVLRRGWWSTVNTLKT